MKVQDLPEKTQKALVRLLDQPNCTLRYHGSGLGDALTAQLVEAGWVLWTDPEGKTPMRFIHLTPMGMIVAEKLKEGK